MKYRTSVKAIREEYGRERILSVGYCGMFYLLSPYSAAAYTCGVYGWNFDVYEIDDIAICTGYRGMPSGIKYDYGRLRFFEKKAEEIHDNFKISYEERYSKIKELLRDFIGECKALN